MESCVFGALFIQLHLPAVSLPGAHLGYRLLTTEKAAACSIHTPGSPTWHPCKERQCCLLEARNNQACRGTRLKFWLKNSKCPVRNSCSNRLVSPREFLESFKPRPDRIRAALQGIAWMTSWLFYLRFQKPVTKALLTQCSLSLGA